MCHETGQIIDFNAKCTPCDINVPFFLWRHSGLGVIGAEKFDGSGDKRVRYIQTDTVILNNLAIQYIVGYKAASISFVDIKSGERVVLSIGARTQVVHGSADGPYPTSDVVNINYIIGVGQRNRAFHTDLKHAFTHISGLGRVKNADILGKHFSFGLDKTRYEIFYMRERLYREYMALVSGPWVVLVNDDYTFNSLVLLSGAKPGELRVSKIVYTSDPYIAQVFVSRN